MTRRLIERGLARLREATPRAILLVGALGFVLYGSPGFLTTEAADQLADARVGQFTDWHSPVMTEIWRLLELLAAGPAPMFALQGGLVLVGAYHLLARVLSPRGAAIAATAVLWSPPVLATLAVISPDSLLAGLLVSGAAAIASPRRAVRIAGLGLVVLACGLREGAPVAALPIVVIGFAGFARTADPRRARWRRVAIGLGVWIVVAAGGLGLSRLLIDQRSDRREIELATRDIAGILRFAGRLDPGQLARVFAPVPLRTTDDLAHDARRWYTHPDQLGRGARPLFDSPDTLEAREAVIAARDRLIRAHPGAYLVYRSRVLIRLLGFTRSAQRTAVYTQFVEVPGHRAALQFNARHSVIQRGLIAPVRALRNTWLFHPFLYFAIALIALPVAAWRRQRDAAMLLASAIGHELGAMFAIATPELRSSFWMMAATVLGVVVLIARGARRRSP